MPETTILPAAPVTPLRKARVTAELYERKWTFVFEGKINTYDFLILRKALKASYRKHMRAVRKAAMQAAAREKKKGLTNVTSA